MARVSWYEAAAYAEFAGKSLPTKDHWALAAGFDISDLFVAFPNAIATVSRFDKDGPAPVGSRRGINSQGALDMAGNVREWCWNESPDGRFIRGGAWDDVVYAYTLEGQQSPWDRSPRNGFRCVIYLDRDKTPATMLERKGLWRERDFSKEKPVDDAVLQIYKARFDYDPADLKAKVEKRTPYQSAILFPAADAVGGWLPASTRWYFGLGFDFLARSGRAFVFPVYHGTYKSTGDMSFPLETCVRPAFNLLGTPDKGKRLVLYNTDHYVPKAELAKELPAWLDKYFGPAQ